jgi:hypothetical protein
MECGSTPSRLETVYTPLWQEAFDASPDPSQCRADGEAAQVLGRMGTIEEVGKLACS